MAIYSAQRSVPSLEHSTDKPESFKLENVLIILMN